MFCAFALLSRAFLRIHYQLAEQMPGTRSNGNILTASKGEMTRRIRDGHTHVLQSLHVQPLLLKLQSLKGRFSMSFQCTFKSVVSEEGFFLH